jgi:3'-phosphoadenosine 5'-phosphosulfate sulfotransferase (PAPS reductase)/FAD synthetase
MRWGPCDEVVFLHTGTGPGGGAVDATAEWLSDWCRSYDWRFTVVETPESFGEIVNEHGYPGPGQHGLMYIRLKDRAIETFNRTVDNGTDLHCWTGIRRWESDNRMAVAEPEGERGDGKWLWHAPLVDWHDSDVREYRERFNLPVSEPVEELGRSADCFCGCFGEPAELVELAAAGYGDHAEWLESLETPDGCPREQRRWAGYGADKSDWAKDDELQTTLCSACGVPGGEQ